MAGGRPTKLTQELVDKAQEYLDERSMFTDLMIPTIEGLAMRLGISRETIYDWESIEIAEPERESLRQAFSDILGVLRNNQAEKLLQNGLNGKYNSTIAKLILSKHGYIEKKEVDQTNTRELEETRKMMEALIDDLGDGNDTESPLEEGI